MDDAPIAAASSARPGLTTLSRTFPRSESCVGPPSAASSTNTSEPHRNPGQHQWPSSGTPQALLDATRNRPARSARYREFLVRSYEARRAAASAGSARQAVPAGSTT
jgi:hypothetical protein